MKIPRIYWVLFGLAVVTAVLVNSLARNVWWPVFAGILVASLVMMAMLAVLVIARKVVSPRVPDRAVHELLDRSYISADGWLLVRFPPRISLTQASANVGQVVTEEAREQEFMIKFSAVSLALPQVAVCYSVNQGLVYGRRMAMNRMVDWYGRWLLSTWPDLVTALRWNRFEVCCLDDAVLVRRSRRAPSASRVS